MTTRNDIEKIIHAHVGEGRAAMKSAVILVVTADEDLDGIAKDRILDDLLSYTEYEKEQT
jgi:hypothetical protein